MSKVYDALPSVGEGRQRGGGAAQRERITGHADGRLVEVPRQHRAALVVGVRRQELHRPAEPGQCDRDVGGAATGVLQRGAVGAHARCRRGPPPPPALRPWPQPVASRVPRAHCPPWPPSSGRASRSRSRDSRFCSPRSSPPPWCSPAWRPSGRHLPPGPAAGRALATCARHRAPDSWTTIAAYAVYALYPWRCGGSRPSAPRCRRGLRLAAPGSSRGGSPTPTRGSSTSATTSPRRTCGSSTGL